MAGLSCVNPVQSSAETVSTVLCVHPSAALPGDGNSNRVTVFPGETLHNADVPGGIYLSAAPYPVSGGTAVCRCTRVEERRRSCTNVALAIHDWHERREIHVLPARVLFAGEF